MLLDTQDERSESRAARSTRPPVFLATVGSAAETRTFSGASVHMLAAGVRMGLISGGLPLAVGSFSWRAHRIWWNLHRLAQGERHGGYQYSRDFLERHWSGVKEQIRGATVVNLFQLYPPSVIVDSSIRKIPYIDMTLKQLFDEYGIGRIIGSRIAREAVALEHEGYRAARWVVAQTRWAAESLHSDYGVGWDRIRVVVPGANLDAGAYARWEQQWRGFERPPSATLRLVFAGKDWRRKGLDRLLEGICAGRRLGLRASLMVVGCSRESLPPRLRSVEGVTWAGFIDETRERLGFMNVVSGADAGCLLSRAEAGGIAVREYHALGLAVLGTSAGGTRDYMFPESSLEIHKEADAGEIGHILLELNRDPERLRAMRAAAWRSRREALWEHTFRQLAPLLVAP
jgi:glycosyltransferase involved in cell wall biosynthesis